MSSEHFVACCCVPTDTVGPTNRCPFMCKTHAATRRPRSPLSRPPTTSYWFHTSIAMQSGHCRKRQQFRLSRPGPLQGFSISSRFLAVALPGLCGAPAGPVEASPSPATPRLARTHCYKNSLCAWRPNAATSSHSSVSRVCSWLRPKPA